MEHLLWEDGFAVPGSAAVEGAHAIDQQPCSCKVTERILRSVLFTQPYGIQGQTLTSSMSNPTEGQIN